MTDDTERDAPRWAGELAGDAEGAIPLEPTDPQTWSEVGGLADPPPKRGILNVNKPKGQTSHDVVSAVRRASGVRRVGHAGTLDPLATGVLVVCIGSATRVIDELQDGAKAYMARVLLGATTTTYDAEGDVVDTCDAGSITEDQVRSELDAFRGDILQTPPMYSAIRHKGRRLYELAREGIEVDREARPVRVDELALNLWEPPELRLEMTVSKGFYVRSLAHDLGRALGVGAHLTELERTAVGEFRVEESVRLPRLVEAFVDGWWPRLLHPLDTALSHFPALVIDASDETAVRYGQQIDGPPPPDSGKAIARAYNADGWFVGTVRWDEISQRWQPDRVFPAADARTEP